MVFEMIACLLMAVGIVKGVENMDKELEETMYYTAQEGDTVERIAGRFDLWPCYRLYKLNNKEVEKKWKIRKGDRIRVRCEPTTLHMSVVNLRSRMCIPRRFGVFARRFTR